MNRIVTTKFMHGIAEMQVCCEADCNDEEILDHCNKDNPSGTTLGWCTVVRNDERKDRNPVVCADDAKRIHVLVGC